MAKYSSALPNGLIALDGDAQTPLYRQLYDSLRRAILTGQLSPVTRLQSSREMAGELGVSRNTVVNAYVRFKIFRLLILLMALPGGAADPYNPGLLRVSASGGVLAPVNSPPGPGGRPVIERFEAVPDCIVPDPRRGILSYRVTNGVSRVRIHALHREGRVRPFHTQASSRAGPDPALAATNVVDPGAAADVVAYVLVATGEHGLVTTRRLAFRYRGAASFEIMPPARHLRDTTGSDHFTRYESDARVAHVESLTCSFRFDAPIRGVTERAGVAGVVRPRGRAAQVVVCEIEWRDVRRARAGGTVEWVARFTDPCTQGRISRTARVNPIE